MLATLLRIDGGEAEIFGVDVRRQPHQVRQLIGVTGQYASVDENLTASENLWLFGRLLGLSRAESPKERATTLLAQFGLEEAADRQIATFSGGMRRRLDLAASLIRRPPLIFLDEPTTGLDPRTRGQMWDTIRALVADGCTVLLTTQYLDEADQLADRIAVIDRGRKVAEGTPDELKTSVGNSTLQLRLADPDQVSRRRPDPGAGAAPRSPCSRPRRAASTSPSNAADQAADALIALRERPGQHRVGDRREAEPRRGLPRPHRPRHHRARHHRRRTGARTMSTLTTEAPHVDSALPVDYDVTDRLSPVETLSQTLSMAWRATKKMRRNPEQFFDVLIQPLLFTAMFAYIFGGAISGDVAELPAAADPGDPGPDHADRVHRDRHPAARGHGQGRLRPVPVAADRADRAAGRTDGRRRHPLHRGHRAHLRHRHRDGLSARRRRARRAGRDPAHDRLRLVDGLDLHLGRHQGPQRPVGAGRCR